MQGVDSPRLQPRDTCADEHVLVNVNVVCGEVENYIRPRFIVSACKNYTSSSPLSHLTLLKGNLYTRKNNLRRESIEIGYRFCDE